jgi:hypothetical protein
MYLSIFELSQTLLAAQKYRKQHHLFHGVDGSFEGLVCKMMHFRTERVLYRASVAINQPTYRDLLSGRIRMRVSGNVSTSLL